MPIVVSEAQPDTSGRRYGLSIVEFKYALTASAGVRHMLGFHAGHGACCDGSHHERVDLMSCFPEAVPTILVSQLLASGLTQLFHVGASRLASSSRCTR
ncbi:hypothetical protein GS888_25830 [Rhodococcus hoagii]|nr:hypothetical protein [Prescottella equi]